jgi:hypothetical protein
MARTFKDRFFTPRVARAMTSPLGIVLAGAGAAVGLVTGLGIPGAIGLAVLGWGGRVAAAIPERDHRRSHIDPFTLAEPWRRYVQGSLAAQERFRRTVEGTAPGPLHDRLSAISDRLEQGVADVWKVATRGHDIDRGLATLDVQEATDELARLDLGPTGSHTEATRESLRAQLATAERMQQVSTAAQDRLRLLDARLDELVARAVELSVSGSASAVSGLGDDVDSLVSEMESLRQALEEVDGADRGGADGGRADRGRAGDGGAEDGGIAGPPQAWPNP